MCPQGGEATSGSGAGLGGGEIFQGEYLLSWWECCIVSKPLEKTWIPLSLHPHLWHACFCLCVVLLFNSFRLSGCGQQGQCWEMTQHSSWNASWIHGASPQWYQGGSARARKRWPGQTQRLLGFPLGRVIVSAQTDASWEQGASCPVTAQREAGRWWPPWLPVTVSGLLGETAPRRGSELGSPGDLVFLKVVSSADTCFSQFWLVGWSRCWKSRNCLRS